MIRGDLGQLVDALREPIRIFVRDARVRLAMLINGSGQVLAQHGFSGAYDVASVASLAAATHASSRALADMTGARRWVYLHHTGRHRQLFLAPFATPAQELILVAIFDEDSSLGLVRLYFNEFEGRVATLPELGTVRTGTSAEDFERELEAGLRHILPPEWLEEG
jgi:predicted regulator of Ras-like GTPase activity (Roadblock/LC7/MglB family)